MQPAKKAIWGWAIYDWANSAFACTVMAGFFPVFFKQYWSAGADLNLSTARLGLGSSIAGLAVALLAPLLGAMVDHTPQKKRMLLGFAYLGALSTALLFWVPEGGWALAVGVYAVATLGFAGANIFYDALLPSVGPAHRLDYISSLGFSLGYLGGGLLFLFNVAMTLKPELFGLENAAQAVRLSFLSVAVWWGGFSLITARWVPEPGNSSPLPMGRAWAEGLRQIWATFKEIRAHRRVWIFLAAYWFYIDGVDTIIRMAVDYGLSLGFESSDLIMALLLVQFVGFPAALAFGVLGQRVGPRSGLFIALGVYMLVTIGGSFMQEPWHFYALAAAIGLVQGGVQALSRSYYARLIPPDKAGQFFGFYNMWFKFAAIFGPALVGLCSWGFKLMLTPSSPTGLQMAEAGHLAARLSILSILVLFAMGAWLLYKVEPDRKRPTA